MHPILAQRRALVFYLAVWILIGAGVALVVSMRGLAQWKDAIIVCVSMSLFLSVIVLSSWYPCKTYPTDRTSVPMLVLVHFAGALISAILWLVAGEALVSLADSAESFGSMLLHYHRVLPFLLGAGMILYLLAASVHYVLLGIQGIKEQEKNAMELEYLAREAEMKAMRAQLDPHFLFNSLNSISALTTSDPLQARLMCLRLADFLRAGLTLGSKKLIPLSEELELFSAYLDIEKIRFSDRLYVAYDIGDDCHALTLPSLLLQPLIENAIKHGIAHLLEGGVVTLRARRKGSSLHLGIENPCDPQRPAGAGERMGIDLVRKRLLTQYGKNASFHADDQGESFHVNIIIPIDGTP